jgi:O-methyltransferase
MDLREQYLDLLKKTLTMALWDARDGSDTLERKRRLGGRLRAFLRGRARANSTSADVEARRMEGRDWPKLAHSMVGMKRLDNLQMCVESALREGVPGDLIETGVWRGGASILMRGILCAHDVRDRRVWVADSFEGLPPPDAAKYPADLGDRHHENRLLAVSLEEVQANFRKYGLLDEQVRFLKGWFKDTLPAAPIERLAVARLDGDMYESTMDALRSLYPKLSPGGFLIIDDYGAIPACRRAVTDFRDEHGIAAPIQAIDWTGVWWRRQA